MLVPKFTLYQGDSLEVMKTIASDSIDAVISDPPYGLEFMSKDWDKGIPGKAYWEEACRISKPGTHLVAFGGTRTFHRLTVAIEDAGWEIRDVLSWNYGQGFPKSYNISKAIDAELLYGGSNSRKMKLANDNREGEGRVISSTKNNGIMGETRGPRIIKDIPTTEKAKEWIGWGTALRPSWEPIILARKPITQTIAKNVMEHGTGALNIDGCRIGTDIMQRTQSTGTLISENTSMSGGNYSREELDPINGRWPTNSIFDEQAGRLLDEETHEKVSRMFYCPKVSQREANAGLDSKNIHPTKKPIALMRWLVKLITPKNGIVIDPFVGSGSTGCAAMLEGHDFVGIDLEKEYIDIAKNRMEHYEDEREQEEVAHEFFSFGEE